VDRKAEEPAEPLGSRQAVKIGSEAKTVLAPAVLPDSSTAKDSKILQLDELRAKCVQNRLESRSQFPGVLQLEGVCQGSEQFRTLRSRLYRIRESKPLSILLVSSATPAEGKTFVSANLAEVLARQRGCRILLIDAICAPQSCISSWGLLPDLALRSTSWPFCRMSNSPTPPCRYSARPGPEGAPKS